MSNKSNLPVATMGIETDNMERVFANVDRRGAIVLRQRWSRGQVQARLANMPPIKLRRFGERKLYRICWQTIFVSEIPV